MKIHCSIQVFDHPSEAFAAFDCPCGGSVRPNETPQFTRKLDEYRFESNCDRCGDPYFVLGVNDANKMPQAQKKAQKFMEQVARMDNSQ